MNKIAISFAVGATALLATAATAAPLTAARSVAQDSNIQNVRMVCDENGRCWRERRDQRVIIGDPRDSYGYDAPRERYIERRGYEERGGIGISVPGVSVGIGTGVFASRCMSYMPICSVARYVDVGSASS